MTPVPYRSAEALLEHAGWMRALASGLVRDASAADDVAQDAALAAILHPPPAGAALRPWLGQVVRRFAWRRARSERRRAEREAWAREPAAPEDAAETLARLDLQRALLEAVRALEEPVRTTLVQRYFEGRSAAEIAAASGVPASTVRARLARGLELLRARLDRETGSRAAWTALVAPLLPRELAPAGAAAGTGAVTASTLVQGALTMTVAKFAFAVGAAVLGGFAWWSLASNESPGAPVALAPIEAAQTSIASDEAAVVAHEPDAQTDARSAVVAAAAVSEPEAGPAQPDPALAPEARGSFDARVVDERGGPWVGAELALSLAFTDGHRVLASGTSGPDGQARVEVDLPAWTLEEVGAPDGGAATYDLVVRRAGCATRHLEVVVHAGGLTHLGEIVLVEAGRARGRVLDEHGAAVAGARVGALDAAGFESLGEADLERFARTGSEEIDELLARVVHPDGSFELDDLRPGRVRLWAHASGRRFALGAALEILPGVTAEAHALVLHTPGARERVAGRVVGPDGRGRPASIEVDARWGSDGAMSFVQADGEGRFELTVEHPDATYSLTAHDGYGEFAPAAATAVEPGDLDVRIVLGGGARVRVRAVDEAGVIVRGAQVDVSSSGRSVYRAKASELASGELEIELPGFAFWIRASAAGFRAASSARFEPQAAPGVLEIALRRAPCVRGVVTAGGAAVPGARVEAFIFDEQASMMVHSLRCRVRPFERGACTADGEGRFELFVDSDAAIVVRASAAGWVDAECVPIDATALEGEQWLELALGRGGAIEGRVLVPPGESAAGRVVGAHRGDGRPISTRAGEDGTYRFEGLMTGDWHVFPLAEEYRPYEDHFGSSASTEPLPWSCRVDEGRTTRFDVDLAGR